MSRFDYRICSMSSVVRSMQRTLHVPKPARAILAGLLVALMSGRALADADGDGIPDATDNCPTVANPDQADIDADGIGSACDAHPLAGYAARFDGTNDYIILPNNFLPYASSAVTIELWFSTATGGVILGQQGGAAGGSTNGHVPVLYVGQDGLLRAEFYWNSSSPITSTRSVKDNVPHHVAITWDRATFRVYLDSVLIGEKTTTLTGYNNNQYNYQLGTGRGDGWPSAPYAWYYFGGRIDEVRVWTVARTEEEVCAYLHRSLAGTEAGLLAYWRLDDDASQIAADSSPSHLDGILGATSDPAGDVADPTWVLSDAFSNLTSLEDPDGDWVSKLCDNCPTLANPDQADADHDGAGNSCDADNDNDGIVDNLDNCPLVANADQANNDSDVFGDACDNCPHTTNADQLDSDDDRIGDVCDPLFNTAFLNGSFETGTNPGTNQTLSPGSTNITAWTVLPHSIDYVGSWWVASDGSRSLDLDGTAPGGISQTFATFAGRQYNVLFDLAGNPDGPPTVKQLRVHAAGQSGTFTFDITGRSRSQMGWQTHVWQFTASDVVTTIEFTSLDASSSGGPAIDNVRVFGTPAGPDSDMDGVADALDNCANIINPTQTDADSDGVGDVCDNCPQTANADQINSDYDGLGDACDPVSGYWSTPVLVSQLSSGKDSAASVTTDNLFMIIFSERDAFAESDVYASERESVAVPWATPVLVSELSLAGYNNHDCFGSISDDGLRIYFTRVYHTGPGDFYFAERATRTSPWSTPIAIVSLNTSATEYGIDVTADELCAVFGSARNGGNGQYFRATRPTIADSWGNIEPIATLATFVPRAATLSSDGLTLYVTSSSNSVMGADDVWVLSRPSRTDDFGPPVNVKELNTSTNEHSVTVTGDGRILYLVRQTALHGSVFMSYLVPAPPQQIASDYDDDDDVDQSDLGHVQSCVGGAGQPIPAGCEDADLDVDGDVDWDDIALASMCLSGSGQPADPQCQDPDRDGYPFGGDNCALTFNPDQLDCDGDGAGDICDNCLGLANRGQADADEDDKGDLCDNCPDTPNTDQADSDGDGRGNVCDNCPTTANTDQADGDGDGRGNVCDNCPEVPNNDQTDADLDGLGNACDNCPNVPNAAQTDGDGDGIGDACEVDCNQNRIPDEVELAAGSTDCNNNNVPDICDTDDGRRVVSGWGFNQYGQANTPAGDTFVAVSAGGNHSLALRADGSIAAWGSNSYGQINAPIGNDFVAVAAGYNHSLALKSDGSIAAWGSNSNGQIMRPAGNDFAAVAAGYAHSLALKSNGTIVGWGSNSSGQVIVPTGTGFIAIGAGYYHSIALRANGTIVGWGSNSSGQIACPAGNDFVAIAAGYYHNIALRSDGSLAGWGRNTYGESYVPMGNYYSAIAAGGSHSLAIMTDGSIIGWGDDQYGQMNTPAGTAFRGIAAGSRHCLALGFPPATADDCNGNRVPDACEPDSDGDQVPNVCDLCPNTVPGANVDAFGCPPVLPGDFNRDGDVDIDDFDAFQACASGPGVAQTDPACARAVLDADDDVDQTDFGMFQRCLSGQNVPADPNCGE